MRPPLIDSKAKFIEMLANAQAKTKEFAQAIPDDPYIKDIALQLEFLARFVAENRPPLPDEVERINMGVIAMRSWEDTESEYASLLSELDYAFSRWESLASSFQAGEAIKSFMAQTKPENGASIKLALAAAMKLPFSIYDGNTQSLFAAYAVWIRTNLSSEGDFIKDMDTWLKGADRLSMPLNFRVEQRNPARDATGWYFYDVYLGEQIVAELKHDFRGDEHSARGLLSDTWADFPSRLLTDAHDRLGVVLTTEGQEFLRKLLNPSGGLENPQHRQ